MSKDWYILQYKANAYNQAAKNLNQQGFETFLPLFEVSSRKKSRFVSALRPLFPGYMFITFDKTKAKWSKINNTYGVSRLVTFNSSLKSIPTTVIDDLMARCDLTGKILPIEKLINGDHVRISKGPFANFIATVEKYESDQRIWLLIELMGRKAKMQANKKDLRLSS